MAIFNALLNLRELKELYSGKPVCVCPLYKGSIGVPKRFETSGNPVVLPEYVSLEKLNIEFLPKQSGTGDPSPDNVRPISGYDSATVTRCGKNLANYDLIENLGDLDLTFGILTDFPPGDYWVGGRSISEDVKLTIVPGKVDPGEYTPYQGETSTLTLPETIYSGTVDAVTGVGEKTWSYISSYNGESLPGEWISDRDVYSAGASPTKGAQVAYKLATPEPFKVSQVSIPSLRGENYFFTNGENMDIIYKKECFWSDEA